MTDQQSPSDDGPAFCCPSVFLRCSDRRYLQPMVGLGSYFGLIVYAKNFGSICLKALSQGPHRDVRTSLFLLTHSLDALVNSREQAHAGHRTSSWPNTPDTGPVRLLCTFLCRSD